MDAERVNHATMQARHRADGKPHAQVNQGDFRRFGVVAKQLNVNVTVAGGAATPDGATEVGAKTRQPVQPRQGQFTQGTQFNGLGVGTKQRDVRLHGTFQLRRVRLWCTGRQTQLFDGLALGRTVVEPVVHNQARGHHGNFIGHNIHGRIVHP